MLAFDLITGVDTDLVIEPLHEGRSSPGSGDFRMLCSNLYELSSVATSRGVKHYRRAELARLVAPRSAGCRLLGDDEVHDERQYTANTYIQFFSVFFTVFRKHQS